VAEAGETACPTIDCKQLALVAQAVSPADFDFFSRPAWITGETLVIAGGYR
jgi:hypothetical protein